MNQTHINSSDFLTAYYYEIPALNASTSKAMIGLSAIAIVGCHLHYAKYRFVSPYIYLHMASLAYLLHAALQVDVSSMNPAVVLLSPPATAIASQFFGLVFLPFAWCAALDTFRLSEGRTAVRAHRVILSLGYFWTVMMIVGAIASSSMYHHGNTTAPSFNRLVQFVTYGLWGFVVLFIFDSYIVWTRIKHFYKSLALYVVLLVLVNVGQTASLTILLQDTTLDRYPHINTSPALVATAFNLDFALTKIMGILAVYWALLVCQGWRTIKESNDGAVQNQEMLSVITGDAAAAAADADAAATHGPFEIEHVVLDIDGEASSKAWGESRLQTSSVETKAIGEHDNTSCITIPASDDTSSIKASLPTVTIHKCTYDNSGGVNRSSPKKLTTHLAKEFQGQIDAGSKLKTEKE